MQPISVPIECEFLNLNEFRLECSLHDDRTGELNLVFEISIDRQIPVYNLPIQDALCDQTERMIGWWILVVSTKNRTTVRKSTSPENSQYRELKGTEEVYLSSKSQCRRDDECATGVDPRIKKKRCNNRESDSAQGGGTHGERDVFNEGDRSALSKNIDR